jgi:hypothetical protein
LTTPVQIGNEIFDGLPMRLGDGALVDAHLWIEVEHQGYHGKIRGASGSV